MFRIVQNKKRLTRLDENLTADIVLAGKDSSLIFEQLMQQWSSVPNPELSIVLVVSQAVALLHQTNHWIACGKSYFSDHKLYEELYADLFDYVDQLAEKAVGLGIDHNVDLHSRLQAVSKIISELYVPSGVPNNDILAERSLAGEFMLSRIINHAIKSMQNLGSLTHGVSNLLEQLSDARESAIYKLRRRTTV